jgi:hypothetical protein
MPVRLGVELSPVACRVVEIDSHQQIGRGTSPAWVRSFARLTRAGADAHQPLARFRGRPVAAVVWGLHADQRQVVVEPRSFARMRREAVAAMQSAGAETRGRVADIFAAPRPKGVPTRSVVVALAPTSGLVAALRWLAGEEVRVESIVTPALALMSLARLRRALSAPDRIEAYVALEATATAVAIVRNGLLMAASELDWGYQDENGFPSPREEIARRLAEEVDRVLAGLGARPGTLAQVCICGGLPELRSMAVGLMEVLDVEVETLDSLFGIDTARLPDSTHEFREHAAELRLAFAAAADWPAPVNLLRERNRRRMKTMLTRAAVAAGVVTGVGVAAQLERSDWWRSAPPSPPPARARVVSPPPPRQMRSLPQPQVVRPLPPPAARIPEPIPTPAPAAVSRAVPPPVVPPPRALQVQRPLVAQSRAVPPRVEPPEVEPSRVEPPRVLPPPEIPLPFDAALGTILYGPERRLAIVDGRIVQVGDDVGGARVVEITSTAVLLRDGQGRLRRLGLGLPGR